MLLGIGNTVKDLKKVGSLFGETTLISTKTQGGYTND